MTKNTGIHSLHVVLRTTGERTSEISAALIKAQGTQDDGITLINEKPFEKALYACYFAGLIAGRKWTITVDADVLLLPGALGGLVEAAEAMPKNFLELQGRVLDNIMGGYRQAGLRIYRTELLGRAMDLIPEPGKAIRPEYEMLQAMGSLGHPSRFIPDVFALHDYEQSYFDLYRKAFVHARKHTWLVGSMLERCKANLTTDPDFLVIIKGLWDGLTMDDAVSIDRRLFVQKGENALRELGLSEKPPMDAKSFVLDFESFAANIMHGNVAPAMETYDEPTPPKPKGLRGSVVHRIRKHGLFRGSVASFGALLCKIGRSLDP